MSLIQLADYQDTFTANLWNDQPRPEGLTDELFAQLDQIYPLAYMIQFYADRRDVETFATPFNQRTLNYMQLAINHGNHKLVVNSGHDTGLLMYLNYLNLSSAECMKQHYFQQPLTPPDCIYTVTSIPSFF